MTGTTPLGQVESVRLEFKGRDARPIDIGRAVVALLNASGGNIWWGVKAEGEKATAEEPFLDGSRGGFMATLQPPADQHPSLSVGRRPRRLRAGDGGARLPDPDLRERDRLEPADGQRG